MDDMKDFAVYRERRRRPFGKLHSAVTKIRGCILCNRNNVATYNIAHWAYANHLHQNASRRGPNPRDQFIFGHLSATPERFLPQ
jgi:hypothetical protein